MEKEIDPRIIRFIDDNKGQIAIHWHRELEAGGLVAELPPPCEDIRQVMVLCRRPGEQMPQVKYRIGGLIWDIAVRDRDRPVYDERLADPAFRQQKENTLIRQSIVTIHSILGCDESASSDDIASAIYKGMNEAGYRPQRVRAWEEPTGQEPK
jgi:hypothetical protein